LSKAVSETELIAALFSGVQEVPLWSTFLRLLRDATNATFAALVFRPPGRRLEEAIHLASDEVLPPDMEHYYRRSLLPSEPPLQEHMLEGQPYSFDELLAMRDEPHAGHLRTFLGQLNITSLRQMRVREVGGVDAWLTIGRHGTDFDHEVIELLKTLVPVLRGVMQLFVVMEQKSFAATVAADAVRRLQFGWLTLDAAGHVIDCDESGQKMLDESGVLRLRPNGKLKAQNAKIEREISRALAHIVSSKDARARAITLNRDPWLDMLIIPARRINATAREKPVAIAYVHGDNWRSDDRCEQLAELFDLPPREARLALALSRGMTLAEAAADFGLTIATARTYSKSIYAKTGARGQPDLVRIVLRSVLAVSP
jgi:DNA-binding CsgD family transcriptional regulator